MEHNFKKALEFVLKSEGGYVDNPADRGGETNVGIAKKYYPDEDIANLTVERASELYKKDYWDKVRGDDLPPGVDYAVFDSAVNHGPKTAGKLLQRAINRYGANIEVDGIIGFQTLRYCQAGTEVLIQDTLRERDIFYRKIVVNDPSQEVFLKGWLARIAQVAVNARTFV